VWFEPPAPAARRRRALIAALVCALALVATPARAEMRGVISAIRVEGAVKVEAAAVRDNTGLRVGDVLRPEAIGQAIRDLYRLGHFRDVQVFGEPDGAGVALIVRVTEKPSIREVAFRGHDKVGIDDIKEVVQLRPFTLLDETRVRDDGQRIEGVYLEKGFYLVDVTPEIVAVQGNEVDVVFHIHEDRKVRIQQIRFAGNAAFGDARLKSIMETKEAGILPGVAGTGTFKEQTLDADVDNLTAFYVEFGYLDVRVAPPEVTLSPDKRRVYVTLAIDEGGPYHFGEVSLGGEVGAADDDLLRRVRIRAGEPWRSSRIREAQQVLTDHFADDGYAFASVVPVPRADPDRRVADIRFMVHRGNPVTLDRIRIVGNDKTWDRVIRREIGIIEGEPWRGGELARARYRLQRLGYFADVNITTPRGEEPDTLDMVIDVTEQPTGNFNLGAGFSSAESFTFMANVSRANFLGLGFHVNFAANLSLGSQLSDGEIFGDNSRQTLAADFYDPYLLGTRFNLRLGLYTRSMDYGLRETNKGFTIALGHYLGRRDDASVALEYSVEDRQITSLEESQRNFLGGQFYRGGLTSSLQARFVYDRRNNRLAATRGFYASASAELAGGIRDANGDMVSVLGGEFSYLRLQGNLRGYLPLGTDLVVLRGNLSLGWIRSLDGSVVPYALRYRAGGTNSLRGYQPYSVGPYFQWLPNDDPVHSAHGIVIGGTASVIANVELEFPIVPPAKIGGVLFFDAGDAFGGMFGADPFSADNLRLSVGLGIRWQSPMGLLRFEWGFPINPRPTDRSSVFQFGMGSMF